MQQGQVPDERERDRAGMVRRVGERRAGGGEKVPSIPLAPRLAITRGVRLRRQGQIDIPHRQ